MLGHIILSHGSDSGPDATKVSMLADVAEDAGWQTERPDFRDCDALGHAEAAPARVRRLVERMRACEMPPVLVGSSMGAFTSGLASLEAPCAGLFLLALPIEIPGVAQRFDMARDIPATLIHGFADDLCPADAAIAFAAERGMHTVLVADGHRLADHLDTIAAQFALFLKQMLA